MDPLRNARRRASPRSPHSRRGLRQTSLSSRRSGCSRPSNGKGFFFFLHRYELWQDCGHTHGNSTAEWFFGGFTRVTGTETNEKDRSEGYNVSAPPHGRGGSNLISRSKSRHYRIGASFGCGALGHTARALTNYLSVIPGHQVDRTWAVGETTTGVGE
jgi:hypothetical protein